MISKQYLWFITERPREKSWGFFMSTRITPPPTSPGGMLFGNCQSISGAAAQILFSYYISFHKTLTKKD